MAEASVERGRGGSKGRPGSRQRQTSLSLLKGIPQECLQSTRTTRQAKSSHRFATQTTLQQAPFPPLHLTATQYTSYTHTHSRHTHTHTGGRSVQQLFSPLRERLNICPEMETLSSSSTLESSWSRKQQQAAAGGIRTTLTHNCVARRSVIERGG